MLVYAVNMGCVFGISFGVVYIFLDASYYVCVCECVLMHRVIYKSWLRASLVVDHNAH